MKNLFSTLLIALFVFALASCSKEVVVGGQDANSIKQYGTYKTNAEGDCELVVDFFAGQHIDAGDIQMTLSGTELTVCAYMQDGWLLNATHLFVGDINDAPTTGNGNPKVGHFPYSEEHEMLTDYCYVIDVAEFVENGCIDVAFHAEVGLFENGQQVQEETAWGDGLDFEGNSWATYAQFCFEDCDGQQQL